MLVWFVIASHSIHKVLQVILHLNLHKLQYTEWLPLTEPIGIDYKPAAHHYAIPLQDQIFSFRCRKQSFFQDGYSETELWTSIRE